MTDAPKRRRWFPHLRFSLRTLLLSVLLAASAGGLWRRWDPWVLCWRVTPPKPPRMCGCLVQAKLAPDGSCFWYRRHGIAGLFDLQSRANVNLDWVPKDQAVSEVFFTGSDKKVAANADATGCTIRDYRTHAAEINFPKARHVLHASSNGRLWVVSDGPLIQAWLKSDDGLRQVGEYRHKSAFHTFFADDESLAFAERGQAGDLYVLALPKLSVALTIPQMGETFERNFSCTGKRAVILQKDGSLHLWDTQASRELGVFPPPPELQYKHVSLSPDGARIAAVDSASEARILDAGSGRVIGRIEDVSGKGCFFPDGGRILFGAKIYDVRSGLLLARLPSAEESVRVEFLDQGARILGLTDGVSLWSRRRPEGWRGAAWLPEFWLALACGGALGWSLRRDRREMRHAGRPVQHS